MWGNRLGWALSACLVLLVANPLWRAGVAPRASEPSGVFPALMSRVALPADAKSVAPGVMGEPCDAGDLYREAIQEYESNRASYDKYFTNPLSAQVEKPRAVELLTRASRCSDMTL